jgi:membrane protease YdiL (CAAX protease family)
MSNLIRSLKHLGVATTLPATLFAVLLFIEALSVVFVPINYAMHFRYVNEGQHSVSALGLLAQRVRSEFPWVNVEAFTAHDGHEPNQCGSRTLALELAMRSNLLEMDRIFNGPVPHHARELGLRSCRSGFTSSPDVKLWPAPLWGSVLLGMALCALTAWRRLRPAAGPGPFDWSPAVRPPTAILYGALAGLSIYATVSLIASSVGYLGGGPTAVGSTGIIRQELIWSLLPAILAVPLVEEFIFRALLQERVSRVMHPALALLYSSLVFTGAHLPISITHAVGLFVFSVLIGVIWMSTRSLWACALAHAVFNALTSWALWRALG